MNSTQGKVAIFFLVQGLICFLVVPVEPKVRFDLGLLCSSFFLIDEFLQMSFADELIKKDVQSLAVLYFVSPFLVQGTFPQLVTLFGFSPHGFRLFEIQLVSDSGKEPLDWFFKDHVDFRS